MPNITVSADLFRVANLTASIDPTRYYLCGVHVQPHPAKGALLVATDGHRMLVIHDETGKVDAPAIVQLSKAALALCKSKSSGKRPMQRKLQIVGATATITEHLVNPKGIAVDPGTPVGVSADCIVAGTFPDWRRVLPATDSKPIAAGAFNSNYLADFADIGRELAMVAAARRQEYRRANTGAVMRISQRKDSGCPSLILWENVPFAFGVLMPMRFSGDLEAMQLPAFMNPPGGWYQARNAA